MRDNDSDMQVSYNGTQLLILGDRKIPLRSLYFFRWLLPTHCFFLFSCLVVEDKRFLRANTCR